MGRAAALETDRDQASSGAAAAVATEPAARHAFGPQLNGLPGLKAGTQPGYAYSAALKASGLVWTEATLAAFRIARAHGVRRRNFRLLWTLGSN